MANAPKVNGPELGPPFDIMEMISLGIGRFRWWILPFSILGMVVGAAVALIQVNSYRSQAKIWVEWSASDAVSPNEQLGVESSRQAGKGGWNINTELQLLKTKALFEMIAREVGAERLTEPINPKQFDHAGTPPLTRWQHEAQDWWHNRNRSSEPVEEATPSGASLNMDSPRGLAAAVDRLGRILIVPGGEHIISVRYSARSPELAQDVVAAATKSIIARHEQIFSRGETQEFASGIMEQFESQEEDAKNSLAIHRSDCGFYNIKEQEPIFRDNLTKIQESLNRIEDQLIENTEELKLANLELPKLEPRIMVTKPEQLGPNPSFVEATKILKKSQLELAEIVGITKGDALAKQITKLEQDIKLQEEFLATLAPEIVVIREHVVEEANPAYTKLKTRVAELELSNAQLHIRRLKDRKREKEAQAELLALENCKPRHDDMQEDISAATRVLRNLNSGQADQVIQNLLSQSGFKNIRVMEDADYNPLKAGPERGLTVLIGMGAGLVLGIFFAILRQLFDSKLRYPSSVRSCLGVPVLGVIPEQRRWRKLGPNLRSHSA